MRRSALAGALSLVFALACGGADTYSDPVIDPFVIEDLTAPVVDPVAIGSGSGTATGAPTVDPNRTRSSYAATFEGWSEYSGPTGGYTVKMPSAPTDDMQTMDTMLGQLTIHNYGSDSSDPLGYFMVSSTDYPPGTVALLGTSGALDSTRDGLVQGSAGALDKDEPAGPNGRKFRITTSTLGIHMVMAGWYFVQGDRIYVVAATTNDSSIDAWIDDWLATFRLN